MTSGIEEKPELAPDKFGSGPFTLDELSSLSNLIRGCPWRRLALPEEHPVYSRLKITRAGCGQ